MATAMQALESAQQKSFWKKPEGPFGMAAIALTGAAILVGGYVALPFAINLMVMAISFTSKAIVLSVLLAVLGLIVALATNGTIQNLVKYFFKRSVKFIAQRFVETDPIGIMRFIRDDARSQLAEMHSSMDVLSGQIELSRAKVAKNGDDYANAMGMAKLAHEKGMAGQFTIQSRQAGRLEKKGVTLSSLLATAELHYRALQKYAEVSDMFIQDMTNEVDTQEDLRNQMAATYGAIANAKRILNGDPDMRELYDAALDYTVEDYSMKLGEIKNFMLTSQSFVEGLDLQNGVYEEKALDAIKLWENKADSLLLGDSKRLLLEASPQQRQPVTIEASQAGFDKFLPR